MWKTEMPFTMVKGAKDMDEEFVTQALLTHVRSQASELGLSDLGATTMQAAPRPLPNTLDNPMTRPIPGFERP
jgi:hypothetical protein